MTISSLAKILEKKVPVRSGYVSPKSLSKCTMASKADIEAYIKSLGINAKLGVRSFAYFTLEVPVDQAAKVAARLNKAYGKQPRWKDTIIGAYIRFWGLDDKRSVRMVHFYKGSPSVTLRVEDLTTRKELKSCSH